ncbi:hypothetical protein [Shimia sediminis]|uniref:hypothetical protein n=1 Tax=Shimia sediminis TaxID=2497945 RepID=UPI0013E0D35B
MADKTFDALTRAIGDICHLSLTEECNAYFSAANYVAEQMSDALESVGVRDFQIL